jgi:hypothetical protein
MNEPKLDKQSLRKQRPVVRLELVREIKLPLPRSSFDRNRAAAAWIVVGCVVAGAVLFVLALLLGSGR